MQKNSAKYTVQLVQVPVLLKLIPWSRKHLKKIPALISTWRDAVVAELAGATTAIPPEPADWTRPAEIEVSGKYDRQLNEFLADPNSESLTIPAAEHMRQQIIDTAARYRCDLSHRVERTGSPHRLVLTKTTESWKRAVRQYKTDVSLLEKLTPLNR